MEYKRQQFKDEETVLTAKMLEHIEDGIVALCNAVKLLRKNTGGSRISYLTIYADKWVGTDSPYSQVVEVVGATNTSQIDITPSAEQLSIFHKKDLAFVAENEDGVITVSAVGQKPESDYTLQVTITEVST
jgi:hypothetical protein